MSGCTQGSALKSAKMRPQRFSEAEATCSKEQVAGIGSPPLAAQPLWECGENRRFGSECALVPAVRNPWKIFPNNLLPPTHSLADKPATPHLSVTATLLEKRRCSPHSERACGSKGEGSQVGSTSGGGKQMGSRQTPPQMQHRVAPPRSPRLRHLFRLLRTHPPERIPHRDILFRKCIRPTQRPHRDVVRGPLPDPG